MSIYKDVSQLAQMGLVIDGFIAGKGRKSLSTDKTIAYASKIRRLTRIKSYVKIGGTVLLDVVLSVMVSQGLDLPLSSVYFACNMLRFFTGMLTNPLVSVLADYGEIAMTEKYLQAALAESEPNHVPMPVFPQTGFERSTTGGPSA